jgi:hypothetical protein
MGLDEETEAEYNRVLAELNRLSAQVPLDAPWTMPKRKNSTT